jgi:hypothetical protein
MSYKLITYLEAMELLQDLYNEFLYCSAVLTDKENPSSTMEYYDQKLLGIQKKMNDITGGESIDTIATMLKEHWKYHEN